MNGEIESSAEESIETDEDLSEEAAETIRGLIDVIVNDRDVDMDTLENAFDVAGRLDAQDPSHVLPNGMIEIEGIDIEEGDMVSDRTPRKFAQVAGLENKFEVVEVTDDRADEHVVEPAESRPENHDLMVADCNPGYPTDDVVVRVRPVDRDTVYSYPISRLEKES